MASKPGDKEKQSIIAAQRNEISEYHIYSQLAKTQKSKNNKSVLEHMAKDELSHYNAWKRCSGIDVKPSALKIFFFITIAKLFGLTFGLKLMESGEKGAQIKYKNMGKYQKIAKKLHKDENRHEKSLLRMIDEERLTYVSSIVLGLNDALVELTGTLAGFTLAIQNSGLIAMAGLITGIAASLSMAASEYLSAKSSEGSARSRHPLKSALYTGTAYVLTVIMLILPFFLFSNLYLSLAVTLGIAAMIILIFTFYVSVAKELNFKKRFFEMLIISFGVAAITFAIGFVIKLVLGVSV